MNNRKLSQKLLADIDFIGVKGHLIERKGGGNQRSSKNESVDPSREDYTLASLSTGCVLCGGFNYLHFHHIHPETKKFNISQDPKSVATSGFLNELNKCVVLCNSCHNRVHRYNRPPSHIKRKDLFLELQEAAKDETYKRLRKVK